MNIVTVIQARTSSQRFPGKVLKELCGEPLLFRMIERVSRAKLCGRIVVATSKFSSDDIIEQLCEEKGIDCYRGHLTDLLDRHYKVGKKYEADVVIKIPSDCPLIDPDIIDEVISYFINEYPEYDYVSNLHPPTFPDGNDVEVMSFSALERAWKFAKKDYEREHTTPYIWENTDMFKIGNVEWASGLNYSKTHRWTIDYEEDYHFIKAVYEHLYYKNPEFNMYDILDLIEQNPELKTYNSKYAGSFWYDKYVHELKNINGELIVIK